MYQERFRLEGETAVVTGGGRGLPHAPCHPDLLQQQSLATVTSRLAVFSNAPLRARGYDVRARS